MRFTGLGCCPFSGIILYLYLKIKKWRKNEI